MTEPLIPGPAVRARANRIGQADVFDSQGFTGGYVTEATVIRVLHRQHGRLRDSFFVEMPGDACSFFGVDRREAIELDRREFDASLPEGPVLLSERTVAPTDRTPAEWIRAVLKGTRYDAVSEKLPFNVPMPDDEFWAYIALLGGGVSSEQVDVLTAALAAMNRTRQVSFQKTLDKKLFDLDSPGNTVTYADHPDVVDGESSLIYRCEIVAGGQELFEERVRHPKRGGASDGGSPPDFLWMLETAANRPMPAKIHPAETGRNPEYWPDAPPIRGPWTPPAHVIPSPGVFSQQAQLLSLGIVSPNASGGPYGFVGYARGRHHVREMVGCMIAATADNALSEALPFLNARLAEGERLHSRVLVGSNGASSPFRDLPLIELNHRTELSTAEYQRLLFPGATRESA